MHCPLLFHHELICFCFYYHQMKSSLLKIVVVASQRKHLKLWNTLPLESIYFLSGKQWYFNCPFHQCLGIYITTSWLLTECNIFCFGLDNDNFPVKGRHQKCHHKEMKYIPLLNQSPCYSVPFSRLLRFPFSLSLAPWKSVAFEHTHFSLGGWGIYF